MKISGASILVKYMISVLRSKSVAIKSKAEALKARLVTCSLLRNKRLPMIHSILKVGSQPHDHTTCDDIDCKANQSQASSSRAQSEEDVDVDYYSNYYYNDDDDHKYPDLRHCLFDTLEDELNHLQQGAGGDDPNASVIDLVKSSKEQDGQDFKLEDEIDHVADLFITKFHKRMKLQKLESFKRFQDMLARGAA